jgi:hypothetical protein
VSPYGVIANLLAMPIVSVMPMGILGIGGKWATASNG